jgi:hypothetical protein
MKVVVWDISITGSWRETQEVVNRGLARLIYGESSVFTQLIGRISDPSSLSLSNFRAFRLDITPCISFFCPLPPTQCYAIGPDVLVDLAWNGGTTNINLFPQLAAYNGPDRKVGSFELTPETPVSVLLPDTGLTADAARLFNLSGTLGSAQFSVRRNLLGQASISMSVRVGYDSYLRGQYTGRVCGLSPGNLVVRLSPVEQVPVMEIVRSSSALVTIRLQATPLKQYAVLQSVSLPRFVPLTTITTSQDGTGTLIVPLEPLSAPRRYFRVTEASP